MRWLSHCPCKDQGDRNTGAQHTLSSYSLGVLPTVGVGPPISVSPAWKLPPIHTKRFAFQVIPHRVCLIINIPYHGSLEALSVAISLKLRAKDFIKPISELNVAHLDRGAEEALLKPATRLSLYRWPLIGSTGDRKNR